MVKMAIGLWGMPEWTRGDLPAIIEMARLAERAGIDSINAGDHLAMSPDGLDKYPYGKFRSTVDEPFYEPLTMLAALAATTTRIRLGTTIVLAPLRPALFLAKQVATLDVISGGRIDLGVGAGWQKEEFDAVGAPWEGRFGYLDEQIKACRILWREAPASFHGKWINFDRLHSRPFPLQPGGVPIWLGVPPTDRNLRRVAELGDGWLPMEPDPAVLAAQIRDLRARLAALGRDPASVKILGRPWPEEPDLDATLAQVPAFVEAGADTIVFSPFRFCREGVDYATVVERIGAAKEQL
jgi:probable F420-dependent oxidoreductase